MFILFLLLMIVIYIGLNLAVKEVLNEVNLCKKSVVMIRIVSTIILLYVIANVSVGMYGVHFKNAN